MTGCQYLSGYRAGEPLDYEGGRVVAWAEWTEMDCTHSEALNEDGCPFLDDYIVECPLKEGDIQSLESWAISKLAGDRIDEYTRVRELRDEEETREFYAKRMEDKTMKICPKCGGDIKEWDEAVYTIDGDVEQAILRKCQGCGEDW